MGNHGPKGLLERGKRLDIFRKHSRVTNISCKCWRDPGRKNTHSRQLQHTQ
jgi:hypothetical protein